MLFLVVRLQVLSSVDPGDERNGDEGTEYPPGEQDAETKTDLILGIKDERPKDIGSTIEWDADTIVVERDLKLDR